MTNNEIFNFLKSEGIKGYNIEIINSPNFDLVINDENGKIISKHFNMETSLYNDNTIKLLNDLDYTNYLYRYQDFNSNMMYIIFCRYKNYKWIKERKLKIEKIMEKI